MYVAHFCVCILPHYPLLFYVFVHLVNTHWRMARSFQHVAAYLAALRIATYNHFPSLENPFELGILNVALHEFHINAVLQTGCFKISKRSPSNGCYHFPSETRRKHIFHISRRNHFPVVVFIRFAISFSSNSVWCVYIRCVATKSK